MVAEVRFDLAADTAAWRVANDSVMGGVSSSRVERRGEVLRFAGEVSVENNGGFASIRRPFDAAAFDGDAAGFALLVRGDGNRYRLRVYTRDRASGGENSFAYCALFDTRAGETTRAELRWPQFAASFRGRPVPAAPPIRFADVSGIGVMITKADHRNGRGPFALELLRIEPLMVDNARGGSPPPPGPSPDRGVEKALARRGWVPPASEDLVQSIAAAAAAADVEALDAEIARLVEANRAIHERDCINLNPAGNAMNPRAERWLAAGLGSRPSLGYPGDKYEMGLEAVERIEVIAAELAAEIFGARYAEIRVAAGSMANLYAFMATCKPGDAIIAPPSSIGGHVTHHAAGAAGLYGLSIHAAPVDAENYTVDVEALRAQARQLRPKLITLGGSLNLFPHPVRELRAIADEVGAKLLFDGAHLAGLIAGRAWPNPLAEGAHLLTMSTYKSLGGPPSGLVLTDDAQLAQRLDAIAFPGLTANFDAAKAAALAVSLLDWKVHGRDYAAAMVEVARALAVALAEQGLPVYAAARGATASHQFAIEAARFGGGQAMAKRLRRANILASGIGLPIAPVEGEMNGLRLGTPEIVRWGFEAGHMREVARFITGALAGDAVAEALAAEVAAFRRRFSTLRFVR